MVLQLSKICDQEPRSGKVAVVAAEAAVIVGQIVGRIPILLLIARVLLLITQVLLLITKVLSLIAQIGGTLAIAAAAVDVIDPGFAGEVAVGRAAGR
jgi:hypothetical protein